MPTDEQRNIVRSGIGYGLLQEQICKLIINPQTGRAISDRSLRKHFKVEIADGAIKANMLVVESLFKAAREGNVTAQIWWTKTRMGWHAPHPTSNDGGIDDTPPAIPGDTYNTLVVSGASGEDLMRKYLELMKGKALPAPTG